MARDDYLPNQAIDQILSFLPRKDAIRASLISSKWRHSWDSTSVMVFDESSLPFKGSDFFDYAEDQSWQLWLQRCDPLINMKKLSLAANITNQQLFSRLVNLVTMVMNRNLKELDLEFQSSSQDLQAPFNSTSLWSLLLQSKTLRVLSLRRFGIFIASSSQLESTSSLTKLILCSACMDANTLNNLLSLMPLLESLVLKECHGFSEIRVSCPNLRTIEIIHHASLDLDVAIEVENLESLVYVRGLYSPGYISLLNCNFLTSLQFQHVDFDTSDAIDEYMFWIPLLENLALLDCGLTGNATGMFLMSHSNLKRLRIQRCRGLLKAEIKTPNLCFFKYRGPIFELFTFRYCSSGLVKAEVELASGLMERTEWFWFIKMRNFIEIFSKCESLTLHCKVQGFSQELGDPCLLPDPFYEMRHLNFTNPMLPIADYGRFIDAMIKSFPHVETLFLRTDLAKIFIEFAEDRSFSLNWKDTINTLDVDENETILQSITEGIYNIVKWLSSTGEGTSNRTEYLHPHTLI